MADLDGDGDPDLLSASWSNHRVAWYEKVGGQFGLYTRTGYVLRIDMVHLGRTADRSVRLNTLDLLFEESAGDAVAVFGNANVTFRAPAITLNGPFFVATGSTFRAGP